MQWGGWGCLDASQSNIFPATASVKVLRSYDEIAVSYVISKKWEGMAAEVVYQNLDSTILLSKIPRLYFRLLPSHSRFYNFCFILSSVLYYVLNGLNGDRQELDTPRLQVAESPHKLRDDCMASSGCPRAKPRVKGEECVAELKRLALEILYR